MKFTTIVISILSVLDIFYLTSSIRIEKETNDSVNIASNSILLSFSKDYIKNNKNINNLNLIKRMIFKQIPIDKIRERLNYIRNEGTNPVKETVKLLKERTFKSEISKKKTQHRKFFSTISLRNSTLEKTNNAERSDQDDDSNQETKARYEVPLSKRNKGYFEEFNSLPVTDISSDLRILKFFISEKAGCSVFVNDTVHFVGNSDVSYIEHLILHNNADRIDPKGVYSNDVDINFFAFNRKLNTFSVYYDKKDDEEEERMTQIQQTNNSNSTKKEAKAKESQENKFFIEFDYDAIGLIKSKKNKLTEEGKYNNADKNASSNPYLNSFIWKILNQNNNRNTDLKIEVYFDISNPSLERDIVFNLPFTKSVIHTKKEDDSSKLSKNNTGESHVSNKGRNILKYEWIGTLSSQEVLVFSVKFPQVLTQCEFITVNFFLAGIGSFFLIFIIGMLYIIFSSVFFNEY